MKSSALARLESGQSAILDTLNLIVSRLDKFEENLSQLKTEVEELGRNQSKVESELQCASKRIFHKHNACRLKDVNFVTDRQEQYSRKSSIRILKVIEERDENTEEVCISKIKQELAIDI